MDVIYQDLGYVMIAAILASVGLGSDNTSLIMGSILASPVVKPILNIFKGSPNIGSDLGWLTAYLIIALIIGFIFAIIYYGALRNNFILTESMKNYGEFRRLSYLMDIIIAMIIGAGLYTLVKSNTNNNKLDTVTVMLLAVGLAINIIVTPSFVNSGLLFGSGALQNVDVNGTNVALYGGYSLLLGLFNLGGIFVGAGGAYGMHQLLAK